MYLSWRGSGPARSSFCPEASNLQNLLFPPYLIVHNRRFSIGVAKTGCAGAVGVGRNRCLGESVHGISVVINRLTGSGIARVRPHDVGAGGAGHNVDVVSDELLLQVVVTAAIGIRRGGADPHRHTKGQSTRWRLGEVVVVDLYARLKGVVGRGLRQGVKGEADGAIGGDAGLWEKGIAARDAGDRAKLGPIDAIERDRALDDALPTAKVAPDDIDTRGAGVSSRVWVTIHACAHARHPIEEVHHIKRGARQRVIGHL